MRTRRANSWHEARAESLRSCRNLLLPKSPWCLRAEEAIALLFQLPYRTIDRRFREISAWQILGEPPKPGLRWPNPCRTPEHRLQLDRLFQRGGGCEGQRQNPGLRDRSCHDKDQQLLRHALD